MSFKTGVLVAVAVAVVVTVAALAGAGAVIYGLASFVFMAG